MSKQKHNRNEKPEVVTVSIHDLNNLGCGVARMPEGTPDEGLVVFVKGTVTGDVVKAQIIKRTKSFLVGKRLEIVTPSPMRADKNAVPQLQVFLQCVPRCLCLTSLPQGLIPKAARRYWAVLPNTKTPTVRR